MKNLKKIKKSIYLFLNCILLIGLPFILFISGCNARVDIYDVMVIENAPDINIKIGNDYILPDGSGSCDFGTVQVASCKPTTFTIENTGGTSLTITDVSLTSGSTNQFDIDFPPLPLVIQSNSNTTFTITFNPLFEGPISATVQLESDDLDENQYIFTITGYGSAIPVPDMYVKEGSTDIPNGSLGHDFGTVLIGDSSPSVAFTVENNGTADLIIDSISITSGAVSDYSIDDSAMSYIVQPGENTIFNITFAPAVSGQRPATVTINNNDVDESLFTFTVEGEGEPKVPDIYIQKGPQDIPDRTIGHDFGTIMIGDSSLPVTFTIGNIGTEVLNIPGVSSSDSVQFSIDDSGMLFSLPPGDTQTTSFTITFEPGEPDSFKSADITITSDDPDYSQYTFTVVGNASSIPVPDINVRRGAADIPEGTLGQDFGLVEIGSSSSPVTFTVENTGDADLTVTGISSSASEFTIDSAPTFPFDIESSDYETFTITFSPGDIGETSATISILNNDPDNNPFTFTVEGEAALSDMSVRRGGTPIPNGTPNAHDFGIVLIGDSSSAVLFTIENSGDSDLTIGIISFASGDKFDFSYDDSSTSSTVIPGGSTSFTISFSPADTGNKSVTVSIENNDPFNDPYIFTVEGEGEPKIPDIYISQESTELPGGSTYDFGNVLLGSSSGVQFTIQNTGTGDLTVNDIYSSSGEFILSSVPPVDFIVAPGSSEYFTIEFSPATSGDKWATITVLSNDPDSFENPYIFTVEGYGETPVPVINVKHGESNIPNGSGIYLFGHVQEGDSSTETFIIENNGTASLIISGILPTSGDTDQFVIDYSIPPINPGGSDTFTITFSPTYPGDKWAIITIVNNDPDDDLYTFRVEGMVGLPPVVDIEVREGASYYPDGSTYNGFGTVSVGSSSAPVTFIIWNNGPDDLLIPSIVITGGDVTDFELDLNSTDLNIYIYPGWNTTFNVTFSPKSSGNKWLELDIKYNDPVETPHNLRLEGEGED